jgi:hypothetical protein
LEKPESDFKAKRRVCKKCVSKINNIKYKDVIREYYVMHQEEMIQRAQEYYKNKVLLRGGPKKHGRPRTINVNKPIETCNDTTNVD